MFNTFELLASRETKNWAPAAILVAVHYTVPTVGSLNESVHKRKVVIALCKKQSLFIDQVRHLNPQKSIRIRSGRGVPVLNRAVDQWKSPPDVQLWLNPLDRCGGSSKPDDR